mmetsp:Transcript_24333/g.67427  ORF Transcript_24333/g.67427 Transcript_24333/m.67427 type:complete len:220 (-) Transcript_24333:164-823(-)
MWIVVSRQRNGEWPHARHDIGYNNIAVLGGSLGMNVAYQSLVFSGKSTIPVDLTKIEIECTSFFLHRHNRPILPFKARNHFHTKCSKHIVNRSNFVHDCSYSGSVLVQNNFSDPVLVWERLFMEIDVCNVSNNFKGTRDLLHLVLKNYFQGFFRREIVVGSFDPIARFYDGSPTFVHHFSHLFLIHCVSVAEDEDSILFWVVGIFVHIFHSGNFQHLLA